MKTILIAFLLTFTFNVTAADFKLDAAMDAALKKYDANFQILTVNSFALTIQGYFDANEYPMALYSDFNRDDSRDAVLMGITGKGQRVVVAIISARKGYVVQRVEPIEFEDPKKAKFGEESGLSQFLSISDARGSAAFQWENALSLNRPVVVFVWNGKKFVISE